MSTSAIHVRGPLIRTLVFAVVTSMVLALVALQLGQFRFYDTQGYRAAFVSASELVAGDPVLLNGVEVGKVSEVSVTPDLTALVSFEVKDDVVVPEDSGAAVRYRNLTGDRFLELVPGVSDIAMARGATIPTTATSPALDLDVLLGGLKPLFNGLDPDQINQFSREIVAVLQGQGGNIEAILTHVASFGRTIAEKDEVIGATIDNLNSVVGNLDTHSVQLSSTVEELQKVTSALTVDRRRIGRSLASVDRLTLSMATLVGDLRGPLDGMVEQLGRVATQANEGRSTLEQVIRMLPGAYLRMGRLGSRGAGYGIFICALQVMIDGADGKPVRLPWIGPGTNIERCQRDTAPLETPEEREAQEGDD